MLNSSLTTRHAFFVILTSVVGFSIFGIVNMATALSSTSGWLWILICGIFALPSVLCFSSLAKSFEGMTLFEYSKEIFNGTVSYVFSTLYFLLFLLVSGFAISYFSNLLRLWILPQTPVYFISLLLTLVTVVASSRGINGLCRTVSVVGVIVIIVIITVRTVMFVFANPTNVLPLYDTNMFFNGINSVSLGMPVFFVGVGALAIMPINTNRHYTAGSVISLVVSGLLLCLVTWACISMLGANQVAVSGDAVVMSMKRIHIPMLNFIQRADIIFILTWSMLILATTSIFSIIPISLAGKMYGNERKITLYGGIGLVIFLLAQLPITAHYALELIRIAGLTLGSVCLILIPIILYIGSVVKRHGKKA